MRSSTGACMNKLRRYFISLKLFKILGGSQEEIVFEKNNVRIASDFLSLYNRCVRATWYCPWWECTRDDGYLGCRVVYLED